MRVELRKGFDKIWLLLLLIILAVNGYFFYQHQISYYGWQREGNPDIISFYTAQQQKHIDDYPSFILDMPERARMAATLSKDTSGFARRNIDKTTRDFAGLDTLPLRMGPDAAVEQTYHFPMTDILLAAAMLFACMRLFGMEYERGLFGLLMATPSRGRIAAHKMASLFLNLLIMAAALYGSNILIGHTLFGTGDLSRPIQSISAFRNCNLRLSCGGYLWMGFGIKFLFLFALGMMVLALFIGLKNTPVVLLAASFAAGAEYWLYHTVPVASSVNAFRLVNIFHLIDSFSLLGWYQNINLFGFPVNMLTAWSVVTGLSLLLCGAVIYVHFKTGAAARGTAFLAALERVRERLSRLTDKMGRHTVLGLHELHKGILSAVIVLTVLTCLMTYQVRSAYTVKYGEEIIYEEYIRKIGGRITAETQQFMEEEWAYFFSLPPETLGFYDGNMKALARIESQVRNALNQEAENGIEAWLINDTGYLRLTANPAQDAQDVMILCSAALLLCAGLFARENIGGMKKLLRICKNGSRLIFVKLALTLLLCLLVSGIVYASRFLTITKLYSLEYIHAPVQSISELANYGPHVSILQYVTALYAVRAAGALAMGFCLAAISSVCRYLSVAFAASMGLLLAPAAAYQTGVTAMKYVSSFPLLYGNLLLQGGPAWIWSMIGTLALCAGCCMIIWRAWRRDPSHGIFTRWVRGRWG
ncbi:MAG: hypothetical protein FWG93_00245 [Oscillospiraceae bacterium]|nr:hypothetical protein [Oscillospiraceae bacterium]